MELFCVCAEAELGEGGIRKGEGSEAYGEEGGSCICGQTGVFFTPAITVSSALSPAATTSASISAS